MNRPALAPAALLALAACTDPAPPAPRAPPSHEVRTATTAEVLATVDGRPITRSDLSGKTRMEIFRREVDVYSLLKREVDRIVQDELLAREAARRKTTVEAMIAAEVDAKVKPPTEAEVDAAMREEGAPASARPRIELYLRERAKIARRLELVEGLRSAAKVEVHLEPPTPPRMDLDLEGAPVRGPVDAPVTLVAFLDWRSPLSAQCAKDLARIEASYADAVRRAHRTVLRGRDELALAAALLAELAADRGRFWEVHDALLLEDPPWTQAELHDLARRLEVEPEALDAMRNDPTWLMRMKAVATRVRDAGVTAAPVVFVNGRYVSGTFGYEALERVVQEELQAARANPD